MADTKISGMTAATTLAGADIFPIVQSAANKSSTLGLVRDYVLGTTSQVTGSDFTTTSTSLVNITGLTFAASANALYEVDALLRIQNSGTNAIQFAIAYSAAGATGTFFFAGNQTATTSVSQMSALGVANGSFYATVATTNFVALIHGIVVTGANAGNITAQTIHATSGTTTVYIGSRMSVRQLA